MDLDDDTRAIRELVREFAEREIAPVAEELDRESRFPLQLVRELGALGLFGIQFPESCGGTGGTTLQYAIAIEELARIDSSVAITVAAATSLGAMPIHLFGSAAQRERYLPDLCAGRALAAFGLTEPDAGSDAGATRTRAEEQADGSFLIDGEKMFITNAGTEISRLVTVSARTGEDEISNLIVENGTPGYVVGSALHKLGWRASDTRPLSFQECRVPAEALLGARGAGYAQFLQTLDGGRISVAALGLGLAQGAYEQALAYARSRNQFGRPIARFQAIQFKLADMATEIAAARHLTYDAAQLKDAGRPFKQASAMAKLYTGELARRVANESLQIHGGYGYMDELPISRFYRDAKILEIGEGTNEIQRLVIARGLLGDSA